MSDFRLTKAERLKSRKVLQILFKEGKSLGIPPIRMVWWEREVEDAESPVQIAVTVPKRAFGKAVLRNRLKRRMREAYRLQKSRLLDHYQPTDRQLAILFIYTGRQEIPYQNIERSMKNLLKRLVKKLRNASANQPDTKNERL
ncbi:MAG: ribonuclease P protein component [Bacteroidota bacterium]